MKSDRSKVRSGAALAVRDSRPLKGEVAPDNRAGAGRHADPKIF